MGDLDLTTGQPSSGEPRRPPGARHASPATTLRRDAKHRGSAPLLEPVI